MGVSRKSLASIVDQLASSPTFPEYVYQNLPAIFRDGTDRFKSKREKDVFLTAAFTVTSGFLENVEGVYRGERLFPNINCFAFAPAGSGKTALKYARAYGKLKHEALYQESVRAAKEYQAYKRKLRSQPGNEIKDLFAPPFKVGFIPGDITAASLVQRMDENGGRGVILETEADSLSNNLGKDYGGHDSIFRKAFQHEPVSVSRKGTGEYVEISRPRLSIAVSGTPEQVVRLIPSAENGLFSRVGFYGFAQDCEWANLAGSSQRESQTEWFDALAERAFSTLKYIEDHPTVFSFSARQEQVIDRLFPHWLKNTVAVYGRGAQAIIYRLGIITFRLAMILTALRKAENRITTREMICEDVDFRIAIRMAEVFKAHACIVYPYLADTSIASVGDKGAMELLKHLPDKFQRKEALPIATELNIKRGSYDNYLKKLYLMGYLDHSYGVYQKIRPQKL